MFPSSNARQQIIKAATERILARAGLTEADDQLSALAKSLRHERPYFPKSLVQVPTRSVPIQQKPAVSGKIANEFKEKFRQKILSEVAKKNKRPNVLVNVSKWYDKLIDEDSNKATKRHSRRQLEAFLAHHKIKFDPRAWVAVQSG
jgi:hypothetical protein